MLENDLLLFISPLTVEIESQEPQYQMELCELQEDLFLKTRQEKGPAFLSFFLGTGFKFKRLQLAYDFNVRQHVRMRKRLFYSKF